MLVGEKVKWDLSVDAKTILNLLFIYSFIYCVFNNTVSSSEYNSVDGRMIRNYDFEKNMEGSDHDLIWNLAHILHGEKEENEGEPQSE